MPLKVIILSVILELPLSVWILGRLALLQSALNPTCLLQVSDFPTHLYLGPESLIIGEISA